jgi:3-deoxy-D-manno-octulosonic-acid transferase
MLLFDVVYLIFLLLALPLWAKFLLKKEYRKILKYRLSPGITYSKEKRIWIHAVSVGEVRSLKYLVEQLKEKYKKKEIVLSVTTPAGYECALKEYPDIPVINAPVDFSFTIKRFIKKINPQVMVLNELEIWPNWVLITRRKKIPMLLINGRISDLAFKRYKKGLFLLKFFFKRIDRYLVQAELYKERFRELHIPGEKITVCGNIKADEACKGRDYLSSEQDILEFLGIKPNGKKIVTAASSHQSDEQLIIPIINQLGKDFLFIIVPRHLTRVEEIETLLKKHQVNYSIWSKTAASGITPGKVLIFDKMGYLFHILKITDIVFMGGTLEQKIGGHNLYEPAVLGKFIIGGPYYNNFPDIGKELAEKGVYKIVKDSHECLQILLNYRDIDWENVSKNAVNAVSQRRGSIQCILKEIHRFID